jgi:1,4-dihydroxy-2-naphthoyl-CoA synthase
VRQGYKDATPYLTKDGSEIRELMHPSVQGNKQQSLAEATVPVGGKSLLHKHMVTEELYHITRGRGLMTLGDESSAFAITPVKLGLPYTASGISHFLARMPLNIVNEMFYSALPIDAERAGRIGILNELVPADHLETKVYKMAEVIATRSPQAVEAFKAQAQALTDAYGLSPKTYERLQSIRRSVYMGTDYLEGIDAFLQKRVPVFSQRK